METKEYTIKTINELCTKITDGSHFSPEHDENGVYPMYSSKDMLYDGFDDSDVKRISEPVYKKLVKQDCRPLKNDILIIKDGNSYLKRIFKINTDIDAVILSSIAILRPNVKIIDPDFFKYLLRSDSIRNAMANYVSGAAIPRIVLKDFKKMKLEFISSMKAQQKIASILSAYDNLIQNYKKQIEALQTAASELYKEWFVRFRFPGYQTAEFENGIPKGWKVIRLKDIAKDVGKAITKTEIDFEKDVYIPIDCIPNHNMALTEISNIENAESSLQHFESGDILFGAMRVYFHKVILAPMQGVTRKTCFVIHAKKDILHNYLYSLLFSDTTINYANTISVGATMPYVRWNDFIRMQCLLPSEKILNDYNKIISPIFKRIMNSYEYLKNLTQQRDLLLPRLMSGKLEVK